MMRIGYGFFKFYTTLFKSTHPRSSVLVVSFYFLIDKRDYWMVWKQCFLLILMDIVYDIWKKTFISNSRTRTSKLCFGRRPERSTKKFTIRLLRICAQLIPNLSI